MTRFWPYFSLTSRGTSNASSGSVTKAFWSDDGRSVLARYFNVRSLAPVAAVKQVMEADSFINQLFSKNIV